MLRPSTTTARCPLPAAALSPKWSEVRTDSLPVQARIDQIGTQALAEWVWGVNRGSGCLGASGDQKRLSANTLWPSIIPTLCFDRQIKIQYLNNVMHMRRCITIVIYMYNFGSISQQPHVDVGDTKLCLPQTAFDPD